MKHVLLYEQFGDPSSYGLDDSFLDLFSSKKGKSVPIKFIYFKNGKKIDENTIWFLIVSVKKHKDFFRFHVEHAGPEQVLETYIDYNPKEKEQLVFYSLKDNGKISTTGTQCVADKDTSKYLDIYLRKKRIV